MRLAKGNVFLRDGIKHIHFVVHCHWMNVAVKHYKSTRVSSGGVDGGGVA